MQSNNQSRIQIPFIQNQLTYNDIPLTVFTTSSIGTIEKLSVVKIQAKKIGADNLTINVGNVLTEVVDFTVSINSTANGINITLLKNIPEATHLDIKRFTEAVYTNDYITGRVTDNSLKVALDGDLKKHTSALQEHEKAIETLETATDGYAEAIAKREVYTVYGRKGDIVAQAGDYDATQVSFQPRANSPITATNVDEALKQALDIASDKTSGISPTDACRVATSVNVDLNNISTIDGVALSLNDRIFVKNQTNKGENGIYFYSAINTLTRTTDANTLLKLKGLMAQIKEGSSAGKGFYFTVENIQGVLNNEPIGVEEVISFIKPEQVLNSNLAKAPAKTFVGNNSNTTDAKSDIAMSDAFNKPFSNDVNDIKPNGVASAGLMDKVAHADHIHPHDATKVNQNDFNAFSSQITQSINDLETTVNTKQDILPIGGNNEILGYQNGVIEARPIASLRGELNVDRLDNTADLEKPISVPQQLEFDKTYASRGNLTNALSSLGTDPTLGELLNLQNGIYFITQSDVAKITDLPNGVSTDLSAYLIVEKASTGEDGANLNAFIKQTFIEQIQYTDTSSSPHQVKRKLKLYFRSYNFLQEGDVIGSKWTVWKKVVDSDDYNFLLNEILNVASGGNISLYVTQSQLENELNTKQDTLPLGTEYQFITGEHLLKDLNTDNVVEMPNNLYHTQTRVRNTALTGYTKSNNGTTASSTILQALGNKADSRDIYTKTEVYTKTETDNKLNLKANLNSPAFTGSPTAPTQATSDNSTKIATTAWTTNFVANQTQSQIKNSTPPIITVNSNTNIVYSAFSVFSKNGTMLLSFAGGTVAPDIAIPNTSFSAIYPWIVSVDGITTQIKCTTNANTPPTGFTYYKRIGSFVSRNGNLRTGVQYGNKFIFSARVDDYNSGIGNTTIPVSIPPIPVIANLTGIAYQANATGVISLSINGYVVSASGSSSGANGAGYFASLFSSTGTFLLQGSINQFSVAVSSYEDLTLL